MPFGTNAELTPVNESNAAAISYGPSLTYGVSASSASATSST